MHDGVYLGLPHADYLAAPGRMGSTDITKLYARSAGWWWTSEWNPHHVPAESKAMTFGSALHALMLEGRSAFDERFAVMPNPRDYAGLLTSSDDLRSALVAAGAPGINSKARKNDLVQAAKAYLPGVHVWDDIVEKWQRTARGKQELTSAEAFALDAMYRAALDDPDMARVIDAKDGVKLTEVSVFWTLPDGIRLRYRFDSLLPTANVDLKSVADWRARPFGEACAARIRDDNLDVQLAMSHEARLAAYKLIRAGLVHRYLGTLPHDETKGLFLQVGRSGHSQIYDDELAAWLSRFPTEAPLNGAGGPGWCWLWLFYQKPEGGAAPALLPLRVPWGDDLHRNGWRKMQVGLATYRENVARFGLKQPWTQVQQIHDTSHSAERRVVVKDWGEGPMQQEGEQEAMSWQTR